MLRYYSTIYVCLLSSENRGKASHDIAENYCTHEGTSSKHVGKHWPDWGPWGRATCLLRTALYRLPWSLEAGVLLPAD